MFLSYQQLSVYVLQLFVSEYYMTVFRMVFVYILERNRVDRSRASDSEQNFLSSLSFEIVLFEDICFLILTRPLRILSIVLRSYIFRQIIGKRQEVGRNTLRIRAQKQNVMNPRIRNSINTYE